MAQNLPAMEETQVQSLKIPWRREWLSTPVFLPGESPGQRSLVGYSPWGCKESDTTARLSPFLPRPEPLLTVGTHSSAPSFFPRPEPLLTLGAHSSAPSFLPRPEPLLTLGAHSSAPSVPRRAPVVPARRCHRVLLSLPPT